MLRFKILELLAEKSFIENRRVTLKELSEKSGVSRQTLTRMVNQRGYITGTDTLDKLCQYFECAVGVLVECVPDSVVSNEASNLPAKKL
jgi:putative transcriptional regulator